MASTYSTNNGIELITTGEQSGTWGATTNTNWDLVDESLDGTVTVTLGATGTSGSPNTLPITDGTYSNGRNRHVIFNDGADLGGTAYVQLTPNDAEKLMFVKNSLSGSRDIIIFQGTYNAANDYVLANGKEAFLRFDGAGAGAAVTQVFANPSITSLSLPDGGLFLNGTAVTSTAAELNILDGVTSTTAELNILDGVTATTAELNILDGVTATASEINNLSGVSGTVAPAASPTFTGTTTIEGPILMGSGSSLESWPASTAGSLIQLQSSGGTSDAGMSLYSSGPGSARMVSNAYWDGVNWKRSATGYATMFEHFNGRYYFYTSNSDAADSNITDTDWEGTGPPNAAAFRIVNDGAVLVGGALDDSQPAAVGNGDIVVDGGVFLGGNTSSNYLDDYEEGSWTPSMNFDGAAVGLTYSQQIGKYTKVGRLVRCYGIITLTSKGSSTGQVFFEGLPFTVGSVFSGVNDMTSGFVGQISGGLGAGFNGFPVLTSTETTTRITPKEMNDGALFHTNIYNGQIDNTFEIRFTFEYMTA